MRKLLRSAGLALVLLPEPFTTPLGLALLSASYIFAHFRRVDTPSYLRGFIKLYLKEASLRGGSRKPVEKTVSHTLDTGRRSQRYDTASPVVEKAIHHNMKQNLYGYVLPSVPVHAETAVMHSMDSGRLLRHYEKAMSARSAVTPEPVVHAFNPAKASLALGMG